VLHDDFVLKPFLKVHEKGNVTVTYIQQEWEGRGIHIGYWWENQKKGATRKTET
jgi:hypothetical protein